MYTRIATVNDFPIYSSKAGFKSLWQKYYVFRDRLELNTIIFGKFVIKLENLVEVELRGPNVKQVWKDIWRYKSIFYALKLDMADFYEHLGVHKNTDWMHLLLFTPENPPLFKQYLERTLADFRKRR